MAKPIEIGLVLEVRDAIAFQKYLEHPTFTREGLALMREAKRDAEQAGIADAEWVQDEGFPLCAGNSRYQ